MTPDQKGAYEPGDVVRYQPREGNRWCREGTAIAEVGFRGDVILVDTYWQSGDRYVLTDAEVATAERLFTLSDYEEVPRADIWQRYAPADRQTVTAQHGLVRRFLVRRGAAEDFLTMVDNARIAVQIAQADVDSAARKVAWAQRDLDELLTSANGEPVADGAS